MKYIVLSTTVWDSISFPDGRESVEAVGGAGIYALAGMKVWEDDIGIVTGVGADYLPRFADWYKNNEIPVNGLIVKDAYTPHTIIRYAENGERTETPLHGMRHYQKIEATPAELKRFLNGTEGVYVFKNSNAEFWKEMLAIKREQGFRLLWEIGADAATPENRRVVEEIASQVDMLSINKTEAISLFGVSTLEQAMEELQSNLIPMVYLRNGADGTYVIRGKEICHVRSAEATKVRDTTGGGNSSTGAALVGLCRGCSLEEIGAMGNVSASFCIEQFGVPSRFDDRLHDEAKRRMRSILITNGGKRNA